jgi:hypothetical protein
MRLIYYIYNHAYLALHLEDLVGFIKLAEALPRDFLDGFES